MPRAKLRNGGKWHEQHRLCCVTQLSKRVRALQSGWGNVRRQLRRLLAIVVVQLLVAGCVFPHCWELQRCRDPTIELRRWYAV